MQLTQCHRHRRHRQVTRCHRHPRRRQLTQCHCHRWQLTHLGNGGPFPTFTFQSELVVLRTSG